MTRNQQTITLAAVILLIVLLATVWFQRQSPKSPWAPTTHPYSADCADNCETFGTPNLTHGGPVELLYDPKVDDPIAQWADCLQSAITCLEASDKPIDELIDGCVANSSCPQRCKQGYVDRAALLPAEESAHLALFDELFVAPGGLCVPEGEE